MYQSMQSTSHKVQRSKRHVKPTRRYIKECNYVAYALTVASKVEGGDYLGSYKEVMGMVDASKWLRAMRQEMKSREKNDTFSIMKAPKT